MKNQDINLPKYLQSLLNNTNQESLKMSMDNVHFESMFSLVLKGTEFGKLTRVFIAKKKLKPFDVQLHTHRYRLKITLIKGQVTHHIAMKKNTQNLHTVSLSEYKYKSPITGGKGLEYVSEVNIKIKDYIMPIGSSIILNSNDFHTMSCSKNAIWIVEELGFKTNESRVLGIPFILDDLYTEPKMFQINDNHQLVSKEFKKIINCYQTV